jgi:phage-related baseplate assembly protein
MAEINLALLPPLELIEEPTIDDIALEIATAAALENMSPSDPAYRVVLAAAYRERLVVQKINENSRGLMLAFAVGGGLDHIGATYYKYSDGTPILRLDDESDESYRSRLQSSLEGLSNAGNDGSYEFYAKSADSSIKDVFVDSPAPVEIDVYLLGYDGDGAVSESLTDQVDQYIEPKRPLTDLVNVYSAEIVTYSVHARLLMKTTVGSDLVLASAEATAAAYVELRRVMGGRVVVSGLHASLMPEGVEEVELVGWSDVVCEGHQAPYCESLVVEISGYV